MFHRVSIGNVSWIHMRILLLCMITYFLVSVSQANGVFLVRSIWRMSRRVSSVFVRRIFPIGVSACMSCSFILGGIRLIGESDLAKT